MIQLASTSGPHFATALLSNSALLGPQKLIVKPEFPLLDIGAGIEHKPSNITAEDWDVLFRAIEARLALTVNQPFALLPEPQINTAAIRVRAAVLECVEAMEQLHRELISEGRSRPFSEGIRILQSFSLAALPGPSVAESDARQLRGDDHHE